MTANQLLFIIASNLIVGLLRLLVYPLASILGSKGGNQQHIRLLIGAGEKGWELIEYQEIFTSACEYLGPSNVFRVTFSSSGSVSGELAVALREAKPTHYYFDPRSGSQKALRALREALEIGLMLERAGVTPVCTLTDFPVRRWRLQTAIVSARQGVVASLMSKAVTGPFYPHRRIIGPLPFPLSAATLRQLKALKRAETKSSVHGKAVFVGMLYEPRKTVIEAIQKGLEDRGIPMEIIGRNPDGSRISDSDYWQFISDARLVVSTSSQISGPDTDLSAHNHFIYRFIEVTAAGTALAIGPVEDAEHLLAPDIDYISFTSVSEAVEKISVAWYTRGALNKISRAGNKKTQSLVSSHMFWRSVFSHAPLNGPKSDHIISAS